MAHGPETEELLRRIANIQDGKLNISWLNITSLPELPNSLKTLDCSDTQITSLPKLPQSLQALYCYNTQLTSLPELPNSLQKLFCFNTQITSLPELPDSLHTLYCSNTPLILPKDENETIKSYKTRWNAWYESQARKRAQGRCAAVKEDLMAAVWHPRRVFGMLI